MTDDRLLGHYILEWPISTRIRIDFDNFSDDLIDWCQRTCRERFIWDFVPARFRTDHPFDDVIDILFESSLDADAFESRFDPFVSTRDDFQGSESRLLWSISSIS